MFVLFYECRLVGMCRFSWIVLGVVLCILSWCGLLMSLWNVIGWFIGS